MTQSKRTRHKSQHNSTPFEVPDEGAIGNHNQAERYLPTQEEIQAKALEIRLSWSEEECYRRLVNKEAKPGEYAIPDNCTIGRMP